jgi:wobble nucleotide-excising tRNase
MIKKIKKIKNLGIFQSYTCDSSFPECKTYNLFYGWNGSGKTTLSKLFDSFNSGKDEEFPGLEYECEYETESGRTTFSQETEYGTKIRVFNKQYIENNIGIEKGNAKSIFILGAENKKLAEQIVEDEKKLEKLKTGKNEFEKEKTNKEAEIKRIYKSAGDLISATNVGSAVRNYNARNAKEDFQNLEKKEVLEPEKVSEYQTILKQEQKSKLSELEFTFDLTTNYDDVSKICKKTVESEVLSRLKEKSDISEWVETGIKLHQKHESQTCEFCENIISESRLKALSKHFSEADKKLKDEIEDKINELEGKLERLKSLTPHNKTLLYKELHTKYNSRLTTFNEEKGNLSLELSILIKELKDKKAKTTEEVIFTRTLENNFSISLDSINRVLKGHNDKTDNFQTQKDDANQKLKNHYLSEIFDDVKNLEEEIQNCEKHTSEIQNGTDEKDGIFQLNTRITKNKSTISSEHKACEIFNRNLHTFLGRKDIKFDVADEGGYLIKRKEGKKWKTAKNLSEGEGTAIAFVYFVVHLQDQDFSIEDGIIVVDDPISSLDSNSLFQAFSFLKNSVKDAKQIFVFTHNFEFFKLIYNWFSFHRGKKDQYFMIKNYYQDNERVAKIEKVDPFLTGFHTEYEYLFKLLLDFNKNNSEDKIIEDVYHIPNIGRKVLETFLMFRIPNKKGLSAKVAQLESENIFDNNKLTAINKFFNDQTHITGGGFNPSLVQEAEKNVEYLLELVKTLLPKHYEILDEQFGTE